MLHIKRAKSYQSQDVIDFIRRVLTLYASSFDHTFNGFIESDSKISRYEDIQRFEAEVKELLNSNTVVSRQMKLDLITALDKINLYRESIALKIASPKQISDLRVAAEQLSKKSQSAFSVK